MGAFYFQHVLTPEYLTSCDEPIASKDLGLKALGRVAAYVYNICVKSFIFAIFGGIVVCAVTTDSARAASSLQQLEVVATAAVGGVGDATQVLPLSPPGKPGIVAKSFGPKEWTVMMYLNGNNDLQSVAVYNQLLAESVGSGKDVDVVAQLSKMQPRSDTYNDAGEWVGARRYYIQKSTSPSEIKSPVLWEKTPIDMGDYRELAGFIKWAKTEFPAKRYMLILFGHGLGMYDRRSDTELNSKAASFDDVTGNYISVPQMRMALKEAGGVDIYALES